MTGPADWSHWAAIAAGGALGAVLRALIARLASISVAADGGPRVDPALATLTANLLACALLGGWTAAVAIPRSPGGTVGLEGTLSTFVVLGVCGSLSTFSTLCADADRLARTGAERARWSRALGYLLAHLLGGPVALSAGNWLVGG